MRSEKKPFFWRRLFIAIALISAVFLAMRWMFHQDPEIALRIGEPWEDMRQRSTAKIGPTIARQSWYQVPKSNARLRLVDPDYAFTTPVASFFTINFEVDGRVESVRMSPQVEPLLWDETLKVLLDLQDQWRSAGWQPAHADEFPPFADTSELRELLRSGRAGKAYWRAGDRYYIRLYAHGFGDPDRPDEERYLITMQLSEPDDW